MTADRLTVLTSVNRRLASKTFSQKKDGTIQNRSYGNEKYFSVTAIEVAGIGELARALDGLSRNPHRRGKGSGNGATKSGAAT